MVKCFKKIVLCIFLILSSCSIKETNERFMIEGNFDLESSVSITLNELDNKIANEDDFILYVSLSSCLACNSFKNVLNEFIKESKSVIYEIDINEFENNSSGIKVNDAPSIIIFKEGKRINLLRYEKNNKPFKSLSDLKEYLCDYIYLPKLIYISEASLDNKIINLDSFYLYIGWNKCSDCKLLNSRVLNSYLKSNNAKVIYYLESDEYRKNKPSSKPDYTDTSEQNKEKIANYNNWLNFASKYNFVSYLDGKVPVLEYYKEGKMEEMLVYHNDVIIDGIVSISFFSELEGKEMDDEKLTSYHDQKAIEFLNKY